MFTCPEHIWSTDSVDIIFLVMFVQDMQYHSAQKLHSRNGTPCFVKCFQSFLHADHVSWDSPFVFIAPSTWFSPDCFGLPPPSWSPLSTMVASDAAILPVFFSIAADATPATLFAKLLMYPPPLTIYTHNLSTYGQGYHTKILKIFSDLRTCVRALPEPEAPYQFEVHHLKIGIISRAISQYWDLRTIHNH